jgi:dihydroorotase
MKILIKNGFVVDPSSGFNDVMDILIENSLISRVEKNIQDAFDTLIDATDKIVMPGLVDMHVHLREPGREDKETVSSGTKAALRGGVTSVLAMPNTTPAIDSVEQVKLLKKIVQKTAHANVFLSSAITKGRMGQEVVDIVALKNEGVVALTDDGDSVDSTEVMREALMKARDANMLIICHSEDRSLVKNGVINLGLISTQLGLRGIPKESEYKRVERDLQLASATGAAIHIAHVSCCESIALIAEAKAKGTRVTAETAPHYFTLCDEDLMGYDTNLKMNPPLRTCKDREALRVALRDGILDAIASDHAPHTENEKEIEFDRAEFGVIGLETELAVSITELIETRLLDWSALVQKMANNPAKILGILKGTLKVGADADIIIVDSKREWTVTKECFASMSNNSSFLGRTLKGKVVCTIYGGKVVFKNT